MLALPAAAGGALQGRNGGREGGSGGEGGGEGGGGGGGGGGGAGTAQVQAEVARTPCGAVATAAWVRPHRARGLAATAGSGVGARRVAIGAPHRVGAVADAPRCRRHAEAEAAINK